MTPLHQAIEALVSGHSDEQARIAAKGIRTGAANTGAKWAAYLKEAAANDAKTTQAILDLILKAVPEKRDYPKGDLTSAGEQVYFTAKGWNQFRKVFLSNLRGKKHE